MAHNLAYKRQITLAPSAARTAEFTSDTQTHPFHMGVRVVTDVTADPAAAAITPKIQFYDELSDTWIDQLTDAAISGVGTSTLLVHPNAPATANVSTPDYLGRTWRVVVGVADTDSMTYSVSAELLP